MQSAGVAADVNVHFHILARDGVCFETDDDASLDFEPLLEPAGEVIIEIVDPTGQRLWQTRTMIP